MGGLRLLASGAGGRLHGELLPSARGGHDQQLRHHSGEGLLARRLAPVPRLEEVRDVPRCLSPLQERQGLPRMLGACNEGWQLAPCSSSRPGPVMPPRRFLLFLKLIKRVTPVAGNSAPTAAQSANASLSAPNSSIAHIPQRCCNDRTVL